MVVLFPAAPELCRSGLSRHDDILEAGLAGGAAVVVDYAPHSLADFLHLLGGEPAALRDLCTDLHGILPEDRAVLGDDLVDEVGFKDGSAVGDGGADDGHLEGGGEHEPLSDGGVGGVAWAPAFAGMRLGEPGRSGKDARGLVVEGKTGFLS